MQKPVAMHHVKSDLLAQHDHVKHAFFTRLGGVSSYPYDSLNCAPSSSDREQDVDENRARACASLGLDASALCSPRQVHSAKVLSVDAPFNSSRPAADGTVTGRCDLPLAVLGADCAPVLLSARSASVVGAVHAGWRGALEGVLDAAVTQFAALEVPASDIDVCIGPCIQSDSYEVGPDLRDRFVKACTEYGRFFRTRHGDRFSFDLPGFIESRLAALGIERIDNLQLDTLTDEAQFFSYRRATQRGEDDYGRQISIIALR